MKLEMIDVIAIILTNISIMLLVLYISFVKLIKILKSFVDKTDLAVNKIPKDCVYIPNKKCYHNDVCDTCPDYDDTLDH